MSARNDRNAIRPVRSRPHPPASSAGHVKGHLCSRSNPRCICLQESGDEQTAWSRRENFVLAEANASHNSSLRPLPRLYTKRSYQARGKRLTINASIITFALFNPRDVHVCSACFIRADRHHHTGDLAAAMAPYFGLTGRALHAAIWTQAWIAVSIFGYCSASAGGVLNMPAFQRQFPSITVADAPAGEEHHRSVIQGMQGHKTRSERPGPLTQIFAIQVPSSPSTCYSESLEHWPARFLAICWDVG